MLKVIELNMSIEVKTTSVNKDQPSPLQTTIKTSYSKNRKGPFNQSMNNSDSFILISARTFENRPTVIPQEEEGDY